MLDDIDINILNMLQRNGRVKRNEMADQIGLSIPSVSERLHKLEEKRIIEGYYTKLNRKAFGYDIMVFILVYMESSKFYKEFIHNVEKHPQILEGHSPAVRKPPLPNVSALGRPSGRRVFAWG